MNLHSELQRGLRRELRRRIPSIAKRDATIKDLRRRLRLAEEARSALQSALKQQEQEAEAVAGEWRRRGEDPSWLTHLLAYRRLQLVMRGVDAKQYHPRRMLTLKLHNYELARSHGVPTPQVFGVWPTLDEIPWQDLPDQFVLKSNGGSSGQGVLPLERAGENFRMLDGTAGLTVEDIRQVLSRPGCRRPFFAEEVLPGSAETLPDDIKLYAFQGRVGHVLVRRMPQHRIIRTARYRYLRPDGSDLGQVTPGKACDPALECPKDLPTMVRIAETLSRAVPVPFVRVDLYQVPDGVVLGELTQGPGGKQRYLPDHDRLLGELWEQAEGVAQLDLAGQRRTFTCEFGPYPTELSSPMPPARDV